MNNIDVARMSTDDFMAAYEEAKAAITEKQPINSSDISLDDQLKNFENRSFSDEENLALHEDALSI